MMDIIIILLQEALEFETVLAKSISGLNSTGIFSVVFFCLGQIGSTGKNYLEPKYKTNAGIRPKSFK